MSTLELLKPRKIDPGGEQRPPFFPGAFKMTDAIDELVARSRDCAELRAFHEFHKTHPEVLDFLVEEICLRIAHGFRAFAFQSLWSYARWKLEVAKGPNDTYKMNDHLCP